MMKKSYTIRDMFKDYHKIDENMSYFRFKRILDKFNEIIKEKILNASESFKMPCRLGLIVIVKYKPKTYT